MPILETGSEYKTRDNMTALVVAILSSPQDAQPPAVCVVSDYSGRQRVEQFELDGSHAREGMALTVPAE